MIFAGNYLTDTGYRFTMIALSVVRTSEFIFTPTNSELPINFIPASIVGRYFSDRANCGTPKGLRVRKAVITAKSGMKYQVDLPLSPSETGWIQLISDLNNNNLIDTFSIEGERISPPLLNKIIN
jgi:hypothetical protein